MNDIIDTLKYVDKEFKEIQDILVKDIKKEMKCEFLSNRTATILMNLNKCYDYCVVLLSEKIDFSSLGEKTLLKIKKQQKYFPFSKKVLETPFYQAIKKMDPPLFRKLDNLVDKIETNAQVHTNIPNTYSELRYGMAKEIHTLSNTDKHQKPLEIVEIPNTKARVEGPDGMIIECSLLNCKGNLSGLGIPVPSHGKGYIGNSYRIIGFPQELETFLIHRIGITRQIIQEIMGTNFLTSQPKT